MALAAGDGLVRPVEGGLGDGMIEADEVPPGDRVAAGAPRATGEPVEATRVGIFMAVGAEHRGEREQGDGLGIAVAELRQLGGSGPSVAQVARGRSVCALERIPARLVIRQREERGTEPGHVMACLAGAAIGPPGELAGVRIPVAGLAAIEGVDGQRLLRCMTSLAGDLDMQSQERVSGSRMVERYGPGLLPAGHDVAARACRPQPTTMDIAMTVAALRMGDAAKQAVASACFGCGAGRRLVAAVAVDLAVPALEGVRGARVIEARRLPPFLRVARLAAGAGELASVLVAVAVRAAGRCDPDEPEFADARVVGRGAARQVASGALYFPMPAQEGVLRRAVIETVGGLPGGHRVT